MKWHGAEQQQLVQQGVASDSSTAGEQIRGEQDETSKSSKGSKRSKRAAAAAAADSIGNGNRCSRRCCQMQVNSHSSSAYQVEPPPLVYSQHHTQLGQHGLGSLIPFFFLNNRVNRQFPFPPQDMRNRGQGPCQRGRQSN